MCGKSRHDPRDCENHKQPMQDGEVNSANNIIATVSIVNSVKRNVQGWWYDICATIYVCYNRSIFKTYQKMYDKHIKKGNEVQSKVVGKWSIDLQFASCKITLINVLYIPDLNINFVNGDLLGKPGINI